MKNDRRLLSLCIVCLVMVAITRMPSKICAQEKPTTGNSVSQQDKLKECNNLADKKNLTGDDRKNFLKSCAEKATGAQPVSEMSEKDKMNACKNLADKKDLKGEDRRSFIKDCMKKANP